MKLLRLTLLALLAIRSVVAADGAKAAKIDELLTLYHRNGQFNGSALVAEKQELIYKRGFGLAQMEWNIPNEPDTKFRIGSITKQFTSMLILQLVEQGKLKLDGKITDYLTDYPKAAGDKVTIHQLLNHTSGIPSYTGLPDFMTKRSRDPSTPAEFLKVFSELPVEFEPGSKFRYNNSGYFLLGSIIEKVSGKTYEKILQENILDPLGMKNTGYDWHATILPKRATGYERRLGSYRTAPYLDMSLPYAAGSLYSTVEDLYVWDQALYTDKLLSPKLKEVMFKPNLETYAYGWMVRQLPPDQPGGGNTMIAHGGGINGFNTLIERIVEDRHLVVLFNNTGGARLGEMSMGIRHILYGQPYAAPKLSIAETLFKTLAAKDVAAAVAQYNELKAKQAGAYDFREPELNGLGYQLLEAKKYKEAIEIFKLNIAAYPKSSNVYDSLAEAHGRNGEKEAAIRNYAKSLEMNPGNRRAVDQIKKLMDN